MYVIAGCFAVLIISSFAGSIEVILPSATGPTPFAGLALTAIGPLGTILLSSFAVQVGRTETYQVAVRPSRTLDLAICLIPVALGLVVSGTSLLGAAGASTAMIARNSFGLVGLQLIGQFILGYESQAVLPVAFVFVSAIFGRSDSGDASWWAWVLAREATPATLVLPVILLVIGVAVALLPRARRGVRV